MPFLPVVPLPPKCKQGGGFAFLPNDPVLPASLDQFLQENWATCSHSSWMGDGVTQRIPLPDQKLKRQSNKWQKEICESTYGQSSSGQRVRGASFRWKLPRFLGYSIPYVQISEGKDHTQWASDVTCVFIIFFYSILSVTSWFYKKMYCSSSCFHIQSSPLISYEHSEKGSSWLC